MSRRALLVILIALVSCLATSDVQAQINRRGNARSAASFGGTQKFGYMPSADRQNIYNRPTVSPYLNLLRPGGDTGGLPNYQTLVRPEMQQGRINRQQRQQLRGLERETTMLDRRAAETDMPIRQTGHQTQFMNFSDYFNTLQGSRGN